MSQNYQRKYKFFLENEEYEEVMEISGLISFLNELDIKVRDVDYDAVKHIPQKVKELLKNEQDMQILLFISIPETICMFS